jgi:hypothetical protein
MNDDDEWLKNNWRCSHGWLRGEQCEICNAPKREWVGLTKGQRDDFADEYGSYEAVCAIEQALKECNK